ncbi:MAG: cupin domain-containing protein [Terriglobales bacterium]|jgi:hypothetical protein
MPNDAAYWIQKLDLTPHPEGGYYRQTYRSSLLLAKHALPPEFGGERAASTAIYFLLDEPNFSAFHRLRSDELWHFYLGKPLLIHVIEANGGYSAIRLGSDPDAGEVLQAVVRAGRWFASELAPEEAPVRFALVGCTVAPGFDFEDFELARREDLRHRYPLHGDIIARLTRG